MKTSLRIGNSLSLPDEVVSQTMAILGIRGSGKTTTAKVIIEEVAERQQPFVWIDPLDVAWGLKSSRDGKRPGYAVIVAGGAHGDIPLAEGDGATIADFSVEHHIPLILSLRHLRKGAQRRFVTDFAEQLYHRKGEGKYRTPLPIVLDECDSFIPQRVGGAEARMVGAIEDLVRRGRSSGIGVILISQRAASVNKDVLTQIELMVAHRHVSPQDRAALKLWIEAHDSGDRAEEFMASLASLPRGCAWFWSPALDLFQRVDVREPRTFDSSATPKTGQQPKAPGSLADVDLDAIRTKLAKTIEQAKADDPKALRQKIAELSKQLDKSAKLPQAVKETRVEVPVIGKADLVRLEKLREALEDRANRFTKLIEAGETISASLHSMVRDFSMALKMHVDVKNGRVVAGSVARPALPKPLQNIPHPIPEAAGDAELGNSGLRRMMIAMAQRPGISTRQIGVRAGLSSRSGTFSNYLSKARTAGWITGDKHGLSLTDAGAAALGTYDPLPTGSDLLSYWLSELGDSGAARILRALAETYPEALSKDELGEAAGLSAASGTFSNYISKLRTLELIEGRGELRASDELFE